MLSVSSFVVSCMLFPRYPQKNEIHEIMIGCVHQIIDAATDLTSSFLCLIVLQPRNALLSQEEG